MLLTTILFSFKECTQDALKVTFKFNVSVGEVGDQDIHQIIVIGISAVCGDQKQVDSTLENLIDFIEENTGAEIINIESDNYIFK